MLENKNNNKEEYFLAKWLEGEMDQRSEMEFSQRLVEGFSHVLLAMFGRG